MFSHDPPGLRSSLYPTCVVCILLFASTFMDSVGMNSVNLVNHFILTVSDPRSVGTPWINYDVFVLQAICTLGTPFPMSSVCSNYPLEITWGQSLRRVTNLTDLYFESNVLHRWIRPLHPIGVFPVLTCPPDPGWREGVGLPDRCYKVWGNLNKTKSYWHLVWPHLLHASRTQTW